MAFNSLSTLKKNRVYAPIITGLSILVIIFVARPSFSAYNDAKTLLNSKESEISTLENQFKKLEQNSALISDENSELSKKVKKIAKDFQPSEILETILINQFTTTNSISSSPANIQISNIKLDKGSKEPNGIHRGTATMTITAKNAEMISSYLDFLTTHTPFAFSLSDISLPINTLPTEANQNKEISVGVTLGLYYYP